MFISLSLSRRGRDRDGINCACALERSFSSALPLSPHLRSPPSLHLRSPTSPVIGFEIVKPRNRASLCLVSFLLSTIVIAVWSRNGSLGCALARVVAIRVVIVASWDTLGSSSSNARYRHLNDPIFPPPFSHPAHHRNGTKPNRAYICGETNARTCGRTSIRQREFDAHSRRDTCVRDY